MPADMTPVRVVRLVPATGSTTDLPTEDGSSRPADEPGQTVVETTDDPGQAARCVTAGAADCVVCDRADPTAALAAVREDAPGAPFLGVLPRSAADVARNLLAVPTTDVVWADDTPLHRFVAHRAATLARVARCEALRAEREQVDHAIDSLTDLFYVIDADGRMTRWNRRFNEWWGLTDAEVADRRPWEFLIEDDWPAVQAAIGRVLTEGEASVQVRAALPDGRTPVLELQGRRLTDDGELVGLCGTGRDITELAAREASLRSQNEQLDEFAAVLSHDLRNPLSVAVGSLDVARAEQDSPDLERAAGALDRVNELIDDVLRAARQERQIADPVPVSLRAISEAAWDSVDTGGAILEVTTDIVIRADPTGLRRVLENLFRNSIEHGSPSDGQPADGAKEQRTTASPIETQEEGPATDTDITVTVAVLTAEGGAPAGFVVADNGVGIPATNRDRVFDRGHSTGDGVGLGLAVVQRLAASHGWQVGIDDGSGARFEFRGVEVVPPE